MLKAFINIFKVPELRKRFWFTISMLVIFRIGAWIPVPGVDLVRLLETTRHTAGSGGLADFLNLFSGGARDNASIFSLGVMPYITSQIIMQLLKAVVPAVDRMLKEGPEGQEEISTVRKNGDCNCYIDSRGYFRQGIDKYKYGRPIFNNK